MNVIHSFLDKGNSFWHLPEKIDVSVSYSFVCVSMSDGLYSVIFPIGLMTILAKLGTKSSE